MHTIMAEFVDNSIDANAQMVKIETVEDKDSFDLYFYDDGDGMTFETLRAALKMGSSIKKENNKDALGCKGVGMNSAAVGLAKHSLEVYSKTIEDQKLNRAYFDLKMLNDNPNSNNWERLYKFDLLESEQAPDERVISFFEEEQEGTIVILRKIKYEISGNIKKFNKSILQNKKSLAFIYRHLINSDKVKIVINSTLLNPKGPSFDVKEKYQDKVYFDDMKEGGWIEHTVCPFGTQQFKCHYRFIRIASKGSLGTSSSSGGLCILRNNKDCTSQLLSGLRPSKNFQLGHLVIELKCPRDFIDKCLTMGPDKQIRTIEDANALFDFKKYWKEEFARWTDKIIQINSEDGDQGSTSDKEKICRHREEIIRDRYYNTECSVLRKKHQPHEIKKMVIKEYQLPNCGFKLDLVSENIPHEFKRDSSDPSKTVGQIVSYIPYLIEDKRFQFVNEDKIVDFILALGAPPTSSMKKHVEKINESVKIGDISIKIKILNLAETHEQLLDFKPTVKERARYNKAA